jgi:hypothetical protein
VKIILGLREPIIPKLLLFLLIASSSHAACALQKVIDRLVVSACVGFGAYVVNHFLEGFID